MFHMHIKIDGFQVLSVCLATRSSVKKKIVVETSALLASTWSLSDDRWSCVVVIHLPKAKRYYCLNASVKIKCSKMSKLRADDIFL